MYDVVIVGGGPAGLSAALVLGRCRRKVLLCDDGQPRNGPARAAHGFFTRDGASPAELRRVGRAQLAPYGVEVLDVTVLDVERAPPAAFLVHLPGGRTVAARKLLLATGLKDELPPLPGCEEMYGTSVFHCPYCDGWEQADKRLAAFGSGRGTIEMALGLTTWSSDVVLLYDDDELPPADAREQLALHGVALYTTRVSALEGRHGRLERVRFVDGTAIHRDALFFHTPCAQRSALLARLGCAFDDKGFATKGPLEESCVPDVWVAGDASVDLHSIAVAVAEGYKAAVAIHQSLRRERTSRVTVVGADVLRP